jgi:hypothetical protein
MKRIEWDKKNWRSFLREVAGRSSGDPWKGSSLPYSIPGKKFHLNYLHISLKVKSFPYEFIGENKMMSH